MACSDACVASSLAESSSAAGDWLVEVAGSLALVLGAPEKAQKAISVFHVDAEPAEDGVGGVAISRRVGTCARCGGLTILAMLQFSWHQRSHCPLSRAR